MLTAEPYKSELLPLWRFRTPEIATTSSKALWKAFVAYGKAGDFVGMDLARKFIQMGYTRARRYANHASGRSTRRTAASRRRTSTRRKRRPRRSSTRCGAKAVADPTYQELKAAHAARVTPPRSPR